MTKRKFKLSLINDYILVQSANIFYEELIKCPNYDLIDKQNFTKNKTLSNKLASVYKKILFKYGLINLSLALLEKQLFSPISPSQSQLLQNKEKALKKAREFELTLQEIAISLKQKLYKMKLNNFEINYLNINIF